MKRKGFTLIELLAVIIILAVIALIAVPIVLDVVESAKKSAFESSAYGIVDTIKLKYSEGILDGSNRAKTYDFSITTDIDENFSGEKPQGIAKVDKDGRIEIAIHNGKYCALKKLNEGTVTLIDYDEATCVLENTTPTVQLATPTVLIEGHTLTITSEDENVESFDIYVDDVLQTTINSIYENLTVDLLDLNLDDGNHNITVKAVADGYIESTSSETEIYDVNVTQISLWNNDTSEIETYLVQEGMTWGHWVNSKYNTNGYFYNAEDDFVYKSYVSVDDFIYVAGISGWVDSYMVIDIDYEYRLIRFVGSHNGGVN